MQLYQSGFRSDDNSLLDNPNTPQQEASIEPMIENEFVPRKQDIVNVVIGDAILPLRNYRDCRYSQYTAVYSKVYFAAKR